jgi:hypothetical protein
MFAFLAYTVLLGRQSNAFTDPIPYGCLVETARAGLAPGKGRSSLTRYLSDILLRNTKHAQLHVVD